MARLDAMSEHLQSAIDKLEGVQMTFEEWQALAEAIEVRVGDVVAYGASSATAFLNWETIRRPDGGDPFIWGGDGPSMQKRVMSGPISNGDLGSGRVRGD